MVTADEPAPEAVGAAVREAVHTRFGFDAPVLVSILERFRATVAANPLDAAGPSVFMVLFCSEPVDTAGLTSIDPAAYPGERIALTPTEVSTHHERGAHEALLSAVVGRHRPGEITARDWRTVLRPLVMAGGSRGRTSVPGDGARERPGTVGGA